MSLKAVRRRRAVAAGTGILLVTGLALASRTPDQKSTPTDSASSDTLPLHQVDVFVHGKSREWTLTALNVSMSKDQRFFHSTGVRDGKFYQKGKVVATFTAGAANYDQSIQNLDLSGPIEVQGVNKVHLSCPSLHYAYASGHLTAPGPLVITTPQSKFTAGRLRADLALNELTFEATPSQQVLLTSRLGSKGQF